DLTVDGKRLLKRRFQRFHAIGTVLALVFQRGVSDSRKFVIEATESWVRLGVGFVDQAGTGRNVRGAHTPKSMAVVELVIYVDDNTALNFVQVQVVNDVEQVSD